MKKLYRSTTDNKLTGLCGGIAEWFGIDPTIVRVIVVLSAFFSAGTAVLCYFIAALIVPKSPFDGNSYNNHNY